MSATATKDTKASRAKKGTKAGTSERQAAANRRNSRKSTGPRTEEGKEKSKHNALSHGLTARSALLPGDDPVALNALRRELLDDLQPRNSLEAILVVRIADDKWINDRSEEAAGRRVAMRLRHEPLEQSAHDQDAALELGEHLFWNVSRPLPLDGSIGRLALGEPSVAHQAVHPIHPARVRLRLEQTVAGCDWLLSCWDDLSGRLHVHDVWLPSDAFKMVRLMGKHAADVEEDFEVARILMSSLTLIQAQKASSDDKPVDWASALSRMLASFEFEGREGSVDHLSRNFVSFTARLGQLPLARMAPESADQAREWLSAYIDGELQRIRQIWARLKQVADADAVESPERLWFEAGPEGENHRRYVLANKRVLNRSIGIFLAARAKSEAGAFDRSDLGHSDQVNLAEPHDSHEPPEGPAPSNVDSTEDSPPIETPVPSVEEVATYEEVQIPRNEPISDLSVVRCQSSVVRCPSHGPAVGSLRTRVPAEDARVEQRSER